jgi:predicted phage baseplate assembly protein
VTVHNGQTCGCCAGVEASTPRAVTNRPGLPRIGYRVGGYADFRASLHAALTSTDRPALAKLRTRDPDDLSIAVLDGFATICDLLTFYTERLANESYLRTAQDRISLQELGALIAYRLRPGVAAQTSLAFHVEPAPAGVVGAATSPFQRVVMPDSVTIDVGQPVRSVPGPGQQPQTFETVARIEARPAWNTFTPKLTRAVTIATSTRGARFAGAALNLKPGDPLLFVPSTGDPTLGTVTGVRPDPLNGWTEVSWSGDPAAGTTQIFVLRKRLSVFGHNAPPYDLIHPPATSPPTDWSFALSPDDNSVDLDGSHPDIAAGDRLVLRSGGDPHTYQVAGITELSRADYAISGRVTRVKLVDPKFDANTKKKVRETQVYAVPEALTLAEEPDPDPVHKSPIAVEGSVAGLPAGRTLIVAGRTAKGDSRAEVVTVQEATGSTLTLTGDLTNSYVRDSVTVYGNVAPATAGETVHQILGDGDAARPFQRFELRHAPLTYLQSAQPGGAASTLRVWVNDIEWHEVPTLYPAGPADRTFVVRETEQGTVVAGFGDGVRGARLPTGSHNVRAMYRKGIGAGGNVDAGALSQVIDPPLGVTGVTNPAAAVGGADVEGTDAARGRVPLAVRTLGRAVSLADYADYARAFAGIAKAHAAVLPLPGGRTIVVTVAGPGGQPVPDEVRGRLADSLRSHGDPLARVEVVPHRPARFRVALKVAVDPDRETATVLAGVEAALRAAFGFDARDFGQPVHKSEVLAVAQGVPGVLGIDLDRLYRRYIEVPGLLWWWWIRWLNDRLLAAGPELVGTELFGAELLTLHPQPLDWLEPM